MVSKTDETALDDPYYPEAAEYSRAAEPPALDVAYRVTFNHADRPRTALVQLPPIGQDGLCTGCGKKPSRETGSCGCHFDVAARLAREGSAQRVEVPGEWSSVDRIRGQS